LVDIFDWWTNPEVVIFLLVVLIGGCTDKTILILGSGNKSIISAIPFLQTYNPKSITVLASSERHVEILCGIEGIDVVSMNEFNYNYMNNLPKFDVVADAMGCENEELFKHMQLCKAKGRFWVLTVPMTRVFGCADTRWQGLITDAKYLKTYM